MDCISCGTTRATRSIKNRNDLDDSVAEICDRCLADATAASPGETCADCDKSAVYVTTQTSPNHGVDNPDAVGQYESVRQYVYCEDHFDRMT